MARQDEPPPSEPGLTGCPLITWRQCVALHRVTSLTVSLAAETGSRVHDLRPAAGARPSVRYEFWVGRGVADSVRALVGGMEGRRVETFIGRSVGA